jgi:hypothetical protein
MNGSFREGKPLLESSLLTVEVDDILEHVLLIFRCLFLEQVAARYGLCRHEHFHPSDGPNMSSLPPPTIILTLQLALLPTLTYVTKRNWMQSSHI